METQKGRKYTALLHHNSIVLYGKFSYLMHFDALNARKCNKYKDIRQGITFKLMHFAGYTLKLHQIYICDTLMIHLTKGALTMYELEKSVDVPQRGSNIKKYPFSEMEVGDSFFVNDKSFKCAPYLAAKNYSCRTGKKLVGRREGEGIRIWRTE